MNVPCSNSEVGSIQKKYLVGQKIIHKGLVGEIIDVNGDDTYAIRYKNGASPCWRARGDEISEVAKKLRRKPVAPAIYPNWNRRSRENIH